MESVKVLLVEDSKRDRVDLVNRLAACRQYHFTVVETCSLAEALSAMDSERFHVVLLDLNLPDSNMTKSLTAIRSREDSPPVVVVTGTDDDIVFKYAVQHGADDFIVKDSYDLRRLCRALVCAILQNENSRKFRIANLQLRKAIDGLSEMARRMD